ncbi:acyltransferase family protein [Cryptosporangium aurantiacum]|uniref:Acyltransferase family protein n=1 Tax=Cryptosporangium aurantiacum TaxID=134849 RepID=A0A1M7IAV9_9ACTN|nr:acyltransferase [Cryptosporangium aurantiacum]SHM37931.1 Acyltransferase family protein [Cryptosporangium aurantiacum]
MTLATRIEAATPADRDRALDGLRALAVIGVVVGHFLVMALVPDASGALRVKSPLTALPDFAPLSWALQLLALFFLVGGYSAARSLGAREYGPWLRRRLIRLTRPVVAVTALLALSFPVLAALGVPAGTLRTTTALVVQPLWFIAVYGVVTALTPVAVAIVRRLGVWAVAPLVVIVAVVDALRYGPWADGVPGWIGLVNVLPGWAFAYVLGVAWAQGRLPRRAAVWLAAVGAALLVTLVLWFGYPASVVGVPGSGRVNSHPPSLLVVALAMAQCGLAVLGRERFAALLREPRRWAAVATLNLVAMTVFCWHQVALVLLTALTLPADLPGLHQLPDGLGWAGWRLAWLPVHCAVLAALVWGARRFEAPWTGMVKRLGPAAVVAAVAFGGYAVAVL